LISSRPTAARFALHRGAALIAAALALAAAALIVVLAALRALHAGVGDARA
jgi:hypothetical protein